MPLVRLDMIKGRSPVEIQQIMDLTQQAVVHNFEVHPRDRYQIVTQHEPYEISMLDTGLGFERSDQILIISVTSRARSRQAIQKFYAEICDTLAQAQLVKPCDLMVNFKINGDADWSFGFGRAQFLTGEL